MKWAGHMERMGYEKLAKRAKAQKVEGKEARKTENTMGGLWVEVTESVVTVV